MWKISHVFSLRTSRNPQNRQIRNYRYAWGRPRSVTSDDLWKSKLKCQRSDVVMCWPKSCIISQFLLIAESYVAEKQFPWKPNRRLYLLWRHSSVTWLGHFLPTVVQRMSPISYAKFHRDPPSGSRSAPWPFQKKNSWGGGINPPAWANIKAIWK